MKKARLIIGLILNLLILGGVVFSVINRYFGFWMVTAESYMIFKYFTIDSNILLGVAAFVMIIADIVALASGKYSKFATALKLMGVVGTTITAVITIAYLYPAGVATLDVLYNPGAELYLHAVIPALGLLSLLIENEPRMNPFGYALFGILPVACYAGAIIPLIQLNIITDPYGFLYFDINGAWWITLIWYVGFFVGSYILAVILLLLHNICAEKKKKAEPVAEPVAPVAEPVAEPALPVVTEAPKPEEEVVPVATEEPAPEEEKKPEEKPEEKGEPVTVLAPRTAYAHKKVLKPAPRTYHVTKQPNGQWQVKLAGGAKAIKLFPTQREAIAFAKGLVESRGGSYRIHSVKGKIRS